MCIQRLGGRRDRLARCVYTEARGQEGQTGQVCVYRGLGAGGTDWPGVCIQRLGGRRDRLARCVYTEARGQEGQTGQVCVYRG